MTYRILYGLMLGMLIVSIGLVMYAIYQTQVIESSPIELEPSMVILEDGVCPGEEVKIPTKLTLYRPAVLETTVVFVHADTHQIVVGEPTIYDDKPQHLAQSFSIDVPFTAPDFPPGEYERVTGISEKSGGTNPAFFVIKFFISEDCPLTQ